MTEDQIRLQKDLTVHIQGNSMANRVDPVDLSVDGPEADPAQGKTGNLAVC